MLTLRIPAPTAIPIRPTVAHRRANQHQLHASSVRGERRLAVRPLAAGAGAGLDLDLDLDLSELTALGPLDGRYASKTASLRPYFSESVLTPDSRASVPVRRPLVHSPDSFVDRSYF
jgi:hypothetical protein